MVDERSEEHGMVELLVAMANLFHFPFEMQLIVGAVD